MKVMNWKSFQRPENLHGRSSSLRELEVKENVVDCKVDCLNK